MQSQLETNKPWMSFINWQVLPTPNAFPSRGTVPTKFLDLHATKSDLDNRRKLIIIISDE